MANEWKLWKERIQKYWYVPIVVFLIACMFYPWGTGGFFGEKNPLNPPNSQTPVCEFCCKLNEFGHSIGIAEDKCNNAGGSPPGSGNNQPPAITTTSLFSFTTSTSSDGVACSGIWNPSYSTCATGMCPTGTVCTYHPATIVMIDSCQCDPITSTTSAPTCYDSDGGINPYSLGFCESSVTQTGIADVCRSSSILDEYYCGLEGTCLMTQVMCPSGSCLNGRCVQEGDLNEH